MSDDEEVDSGAAFLREVAHVDTVDPPSLGERAVGARLGRFVLRSELGRGGMGIVYRAEDEQLGRIVALKVLRADRQRDPQRRARFLREARSAAALVHRNVAAVYEIGDVDGELFIAMELVAGESLRERLNARGALSVREAVTIGKGVARALAAAHAKGIVHRDLKPENVMLAGASAEGGETTSDDGEPVEPKVLDFGLAKIHQGTVTPRDVLERQSTDALTEDGHLLGTPEYMSPEQVRGKQVDARSDVFAFGILLYEMLAGTRPFAGASAMDIAIAIVRDEPVSLVAHVPSVPRLLVAVVETCLAKPLTSRYATARSLLEALEAADPDRTSLAPLRESGAPGPRARRRRVTLAATFLLSSTLIGALAAAVGVARHRWADATAPLSPSAAPLEDASAHAARAMTEYPSPPTTSAEAAAAYLAGLHHFRDGSLRASQADFERAVSLDSTFAAAHLRLLKVGWVTPDALIRAREHFAAAVQFRRSLDGRDRLLLAAAEASTRDVVDAAALIKGLRAVLEQYPDDPETLFELGNAYLFTDETDATRDALQRALLRDPEFAAALVMLAGMDMFTDPQGAQRFVDRCLSVAPMATMCLEIRMRIDVEHGQCAEYEETCRRLIAVAPKEPDGDWCLADALARREAPLESVRNLLDKEAELTLAIDPSSGPSSRDHTAIALATLVGDFAPALAAVRDLDELAAGDTSEAGHAEQAMTAITLLEEEGETAKALRVAEDFERRAPAWTANDFRVRHYLLYARHHAHVLDDDAFAQGFAAIEKEAFARYQRFRAGAELYLHAAYADAGDLADALPYAERPSLLISEGDALRGKVLLLAGRFDEAIPALRRAAAACGVLPAEWANVAEYEPFAAMHVQLWLGEALEAKGDTDGACDAYRVVLRRWKNAKPRSVTVDTARARARALSCR